MTALEKMRAWIATFPGFDILASYQVNFTDQIPTAGEVFPKGLEELERRRDIFGDVTVTNEYHFGLYRTVEKTAEGGGATNIDTGWVMDFQEWVQEQSVRGEAPTFGNTDVEGERMYTLDGRLYEKPDQTTATYLIQLNARFKKKF